MSRTNDFVCDASIEIRLIANGLKPFKCKRQSRPETVVQKCIAGSTAVRYPPNIRRVASLGRHQGNSFSHATIRRCCKRTQDVLAVQNGSPKFKNVRLFWQLNT
jgi:hypothetical protein